MEPQPFTSDGVAQMVANLYALPDDQLAEQANLIQSNFVSWMDNNFILSSDQQTYLANMDAQFIAMAAVSTSIAVKSRLNITVEFDGGPGGLKLVRQKPHLDIAYDTTNGFVATGELDYTISYQP